MNTAIYLRVSTDKQTTDSQAVELREYVRRRGWDNVTEYSDVTSGAKFSRTGLDALMREVRRGRVDRLVAYKLDRIGRSLGHLVGLVSELQTHKCALVTVSEGIDTSETNPAAQLQLNILGAVCQFEREIIRERVQSGLKAAVARGQRLGRPLRHSKSICRAFASC